MGYKSRGGWSMGCWKRFGCKNRDKKCNTCDKYFSEFEEKEEEKEK
jgi:hypothetical protein